MKLWSYTGPSVGGKKSEMMCLAETPEDALSIFALAKKRVGLADEIPAHMNWVCAVDKARLVFAINPHDHLQPERADHG